ncbi:hypothetical protein K461DRAFT_294343 [Myriangium duriaei CBS 260.36]|uniref:Uncharacterized protein n=1 Tax=Myriangium duriaei CBS 260.36 TaxID=1168546 RepID=A0A9P4MMF7_9PEZI|nr:hypothetical protein K461DRAFT_294343 [Myriangium duriaei CBS 260.36]
MALVLPDQIVSGSKWTMVGWPEEEMPHFRVLPEHAGDVDFWSQRDMQTDVQRRLSNDSYGGNMPEVRLDEVFLRTENQFGLYETFGVKALIIKVIDSNHFDPRGRG